MDVQVKKNEVGGAYSTYGGEMYTGCWWGNLREGYLLEDPGIDGRIILKRVFQKCDTEACTGLM
jgi:hypothetical protein